jgi:hypothetical protein
MYIKVALKVYIVKNVDCTLECTGYRRQDGDGGDGCFPQRPVSLCPSADFQDVEIVRRGESDPALLAESTVLVVEAPVVG